MENSMRKIFLFLAVFTVLIFAGLAATCAAKNKLTAIPYQKQQPGKMEKWVIFWKNFISAIDTKDKVIIAGLTAKDFYDGGGGTVEQWLDSEVFRTDETFADFRNKLRKGVNDFKGFDGKPYKATGRNKSGELFFEYKNNQWLFGGLVGD
jgi:hypothetical protein